MQKMRTKQLDFFLTMEKHNMDNINLLSESEQNMVFINEKRKSLVDGQNIERKKMELKKQKVDYIMNAFENDENSDEKNDQCDATVYENEDQNDQTGKSKHKDPKSIKNPTYKEESQNDFKNEEETGENVNSLAYLDICEIKDNSSNEDLHELLEMMQEEIIAICDDTRYCSKARF